MFAVAAPLLMISQVTFVAPSEPEGQLGIVVVAALSSLAAVALVLLAADRTVLRHRRTSPVSVGAVAGVGALAGLVRAAVAIAVTALMSGVDPPMAEVLGRMVAGSAAGAVMLPLAAWAFGSADLLRRERLAVQEELAATEMRTALARAQAAALREQIRHIAADNVRLVTADLESKVLDASLDDGGLADELVNAAEDRVRPLGRALWSDDETPAHLPWRTAFVDSAVTRPVSPWIVAVILIAVSAPREFSTRPAWEAAGVIVVTTALITGALTAAALVPPPSRRWWQIAILLTLACTILAGIGVLWLRLDWVAAAGDALAVLLVTGATVALAALVQAANARAHDRLEALRARLGQAHLASLAAARLRRAAEREAAVVLHSRVQNALLGAAATVRRGGDHARGPWLTDLLASLPDVVMTDRSDSLGLEDVADAWSGVVDISIRMPPDLPPRVAGDAAVIAQEAVANAFRHAQASAIRIVIDPSLSGWQIAIDADGASPAADLRAGIGLRRVAEHAREWRLDAGPSGGSRLVAMLDPDPEDSAESRPQRGTDHVVGRP